MPSLLTTLHNLIPAFHRPLSVPVPVLLFTVTLPPLLLFTFTFTLPSLLTSYRTYLAIGPGGVPHNLFGFLAQSCLRLIARSDGRASPPPYRRGRQQQQQQVEDVQLVKGGRGRGDGGNENSLPTGAGDRPVVPDFVAPQRQTSMQAAPAMVARMQAFLSELAAGNPSVLEIRPSGLEGKWHNAVFLREAAGTGEGGGLNVPEFMGMAKGEIVHVHSEGSSHVTLSLVDGEEAVRVGCYPGRRDIP
ncbi:hypothetical protein NEMBOFW57_002619 [Staphylotrichum longicolle]|uniref:Uncharacterized protein n=1 Tax=Staphylotrichum longicolle TaxID=669026 RepID=A0AAD4F4F1_9PEZI|nr:hypothetical protein NEMBOFW57_002619 [Staphylotrichum longicolle]